MERDAILCFVNEGGIGVSPFEQRRWVQLSGDDDIISHASDYSDISGWLRVPVEYWIGHDGHTVDDDPDGPEYNSDYDFDDESGPDSDPEEAQIEAGVKSDTKSAEGRFYNEIWSELTSL